MSRNTTSIRWNYFYIILFALLGTTLLVGGLFLNFSKNNIRETQVQESLNISSENNIHSEIEIDTDKKNILAKNIIIQNITTDDILYRQNIDRPIPLASLVKIMTALVAREAIPQDTMISISENALHQYGDHGLRAGELWNRDELVHFMLITSSNDAAQAIAESIENPIATMNSYAQKIGMRQTTFLNVTGLDEHGKNGGYASLEDVAVLIRYILINHPDLLESTAYQKTFFSSSIQEIISAQNTNTFLNKLPVIRFSKTGFTSITGGNLLTIADLGLGQLYLVIVTGSTFEGRFTDTVTLYGILQDYLNHTKNAVY